MKGTPEAEFVVGRFYRVRCVVTSARHHCGWGAGAVVPVIGDVHEDPEVIGFPHRHVHVDWRFVSEQRYLAVKRELEPRHGIGTAAARVIVEPEAGFVFRRLKMRRETPIFPTSAPWFTRLETRYRSAIARCGVCPHKGISLAGAPIEDGARVCPGHGLAWDEKTGALRVRVRAMPRPG